MNIPGYFSILTADVRYSKDLTDFEKLLFSEISALSQKNGYCTASNSYFAELFGKAKETVSRSISKMAKLKFLNVVEVRNHKKEVVLRKIHVVTEPKNIDAPIDENINTPIDDSINPLLTKISIGIDENVKGNNTRNNNTRINNPLPLCEPEASDCADAPVADHAATDGGSDGALGDTAGGEIPPERSRKPDKQALGTNPKSTAQTPVREIMQAYNEILGGTLPKVVEMTDYRKREVSARWKQLFGSLNPKGEVRYADTQSGLNYWRRLFAKVLHNPHWCGNNDRNWRADFDWFMKPRNFTKLVEFIPQKR